MRLGPFEGVVVVVVVVEVVVVVVVVVVVKRVQGQKMKNQTREKVESNMATAS